jgi:hypothetical protein
MKQAFTLTEGVCLLRRFVELSRKSWRTFQRYLLPILPGRWIIHRPDDRGGKTPWNTRQFLRDYKAQHPRQVTFIFTAVKNLKSHFYWLLFIRNRTSILKPRACIPDSWFRLYIGTDCRRYIKAVLLPVFYVFLHVSITWSTWRDSTFDVTINSWLASSTPLKL